MFSRGPALSPCSLGSSWNTEDYIKAHHLIRASGKYNFEGCRIPVPTSIRFDRIRASLGDQVTQKDLKMLSLLEFGMPIACDLSYGIRKPQRNHHSAVSFGKEVSIYFNKGTSAKALLGPFESSPIPELRFSPLMTVPKEVTERRVIVDFSFPPGKAINDGIPRSTYLEFEVCFSLPSIKSMVIGSIVLAKAA